MAFVLVQHLDPTHESNLVGLLSKATSIPIVQASQDQAVRPDHVYVMPRNTTITIASGILKLAPRGEARGLHLPIDLFFKSLADDRQSSAIGVILSGTGSDGTLGLAEIKAAGGITFAQDRASAKQNGMPNSAVGSGAVDFVLSPGQIALELTRMGRHPYLVSSRTAEEGTMETGEEEAFRKIIALLRSNFGVDFTQYRDTTIKRRAMRRMVLQTKDTLADYARQLEADRPELQALYQDILINVTSFFRDPASLPCPQDQRLPGDRQGKIFRKPRQGLGRGMFHRSGSLLPGHRARGIPGRAAGPSRDPGLRHRPQRHRFAGGGACRGVPGEHRGRSLAGTAQAVLQQGGRQVPDQQVNS